MMFARTLFLELIAAALRERLSRAPDVAAPVKVITGAKGDTLFVEIVPFSEFVAMSLSREAWS